MSQPIVPSVPAISTSTFLVYQPGSRVGSAYYAVAEPRDYLSKGEGNIYDPSIDRLVPVTFTGKVLGVTGRNGFIRSAMVEGVIVSRGTPAERWHSPTAKKEVLAAVRHPPTIGEVDLQTGFLLGVSACLDHGVCPAGSPEGLFKERQGKDVYEATKAAALAVWREEALGIVHKHAPEGSSVETYDHQWKWSGYWGRIETPNDPHFAHSEELELNFHGEGKVFVTTPAGEEVRVGIRQHDGSRSPEWQLAIGGRMIGGCSGGLGNASGWIKTAGEELMKLPVPAWPASPDGLPD